MLCLSCRGVCGVGDMLRSSRRRGRAPANRWDVLAMFRLVYSREGATQPLVDDSL